MEKYLKLARPSVIKSVYEHPEQWLLKYKEFGKSHDIKDYSKEEVSQMLYGIYPYSGYILVDGDYFINIKDVIQAGCTLKTLTSSCKLDLSNPVPIDKIRTFYVENYYLITRNSVNGTNKYYINSYLLKVKGVRHGRGRFKRLYSIANNYQCLQSFPHGYVPKDLFYPIEFYINSVFFGDQYRICDFVVDSELQVSYIGNQ